MAVETISVLHRPTDLQPRDIVNTRRLANAAAAIRTRRKQTKRSVGSTRILSIDLAIVVDGECFSRRYTVQSTGENNGGPFFVIHTYYTMSDCRRRSSFFSSIPPHVRVLLYTMGITFHLWYLFPAFAVKRYSTPASGMAIPLLPP